MLEWFFCVCNVSISYLFYVRWIYIQFSLGVFLFIFLSIFSIFGRNQVIFRCTVLLLLICDAFVGSSIFGDLPYISFVHSLKICSAFFGTFFIVDNDRVREHRLDHHRPNHYQNQRNYKRIHFWTRWPDRYICISKCINSMDIMGMWLLLLLLGGANGAKTTRTSAIPSWRCLLSVCRRTFNTSIYLHFRVTVVRFMQKHIFILLPPPLPPMLQWIVDYLCMAKWKLSEYQHNRWMASSIQQKQFDCLALMSVLSYLPKWLTQTHAAVRLALDFSAPFECSIKSYSSNHLHFNLNEASTSVDCPISIRKQFICHWICVIK